MGWGGGGSEEGEGEKHARTQTQIHVETHTYTRAEPLEMVEWQAQPRDWSGEDSDDRKEVFFFLIQSQVMFIKVENDCSPGE